MSSRTITLAGTLAVVLLALVAPRAAYAQNEPLDKKAQEAVRVEDKRGRPETLVALEEAVKKSPDSAEAHFELGRALAQSGSLERAAVELAQAVTLGGSDKGPALGVRAGAVYYGLGRIDDAIQLWSDSKTDDALYNLGLAYRQKGLLVSAIGVLRELTTRTPTSQAGLYLLADTYARANDHASAVATYEALVKLAPTHFEGWNNLGNLRMEGGNVGLAREAYEAGLRHFGENYVQEFEGKIDEVRHLAGARFHLIGHLQSNKVKYIASFVSLIHSVDSLKLLSAINKEGQKIERVKELLVYDELSLSQIAWELGYSSVAHLSAQFKKVTGLTPGHFRQIGHNKRKPLDQV